MKHLSLSGRLRLALVRRKRTRRRVESEDKARELRQRADDLWSEHQRRRALARRPSGKAAANRPIRIYAPAEFSLSSGPERRQVLRFLKELREQTLLKGHQVQLNFGPTKKLFSDGTLLFAAELDRINRATAPRRLVQCSYPADEVVEQAFQHLGLLEMMQRQGKTQVQAENVKFWRVDSDTLVTGERTNGLIEEYKRYFSGPKAQKLYKGLTEAMTNCKHHAYTHKRRDGTNVDVEPRWWMFSEIRDGYLSVSICDLGIGINRSLSEGVTWSLEQVLETLKQVGGKKDSSYIKAAMVLGKSRTHEEYRGKGLQELKNVIDSVGEGWLRILSNRGSYHYSAKDKAETLAEFGGSILGTLVLWRIPIPALGQS